MPNADPTPRTPGPQTDAAREREPEWWVCEDSSGKKFYRSEDEAVRALEKKREAGSCARPMYAHEADSLGAGAAPSRDDAWLREYKRLRSALVLEVDRVSSKGDCSWEGIDAAERALDEWVMGAGAAPAEREGLYEALVSAWDSGALSLWTEADIAPYRALATAPREQEPPVECPNCHFYPIVTPTPEPPAPGALRTALLRAKQVEHWHPEQCSFCDEIDTALATAPDETCSKCNGRWLATYTDEMGVEYLDACDRCRGRAAAARRATSTGEATRLAERLKRIADHLQSEGDFASADACYAAANVLRGERASEDEVRYRCGCVKQGERTIPCQQHEPIEDR